MEGPVLFYFKTEGSTEVLACPLLEGRLDMNPMLEELGFSTLRIWDPAAEVFVLVPSVQVGNQVLSLQRYDDNPGSKDAPRRLSGKPRGNSAAGGATTGAAAPVAGAVKNANLVQTIAGLKQMCSMFSAADIDADFILVPPEVVKLKLLPRPMRTSIYVRKCYRRLLELMEAAGPEAASILTGSPGIGKSAFVLLLLCYLAKRKCKVLYKHSDPLVGPQVVVMDFDSGEADYAHGADAAPLADQHIASGIWVLIDGAPGPGQYGGTGTTVVMTSPNETNWHDFNKGSDVQVLYMDVWNLDEINKCRQRLFPGVTEAAAAERFRVFGGVVRHVLVNVNYSLEELENSVPASDAADLVNMSLVGVRSKISHTLVHMRASKDFKFRYFMLASPVVAALVFRKALEHNQQRVLHLIKASAGQSSVAGFRGIMFEQHGHVLVPAGMCVRMRQLQPSRKRQLQHEQGSMASGSGAVEEGKEELAGGAGTMADEGDEEECGGEGGAVEDGPAAGPESHHYLLKRRAPMEEDTSNSAGGEALGRLRLGEATPGDRVQLAKVPHQWDQLGLPLRLLDSCYLQPPGINNASWDAYYCSNSAGSQPQRMILQYNVSDDHAVLAQPVVQLLERLEVTGSEVRLVFVVPSDPPGLYERYTWQPWWSTKRSVLQRLPPALKDMQQWVMELPLSPSISRPDSGGSHGSQEHAQAAMGLVP